jgi:hypothetical protein
MGWVRPATTLLIMFTLSSTSLTALPFVPGLNALPVSVRRGSIAARAS